MNDRMPEGVDLATTPQDAGLPDPVERDPAALNSAEDLDEDRLQLDPLEEGMDPPERWSGADRYGTTPYEQSHPRELDDRLREEEPDVRPEPVRADGSRPLDDSIDDRTDDADPLSIQPEEDRHPQLSEMARDGRSADEAGGSMAETIRTPPQPPQ